MSNDPKADLIYAILAMDVYNRGYDSGISNLDEEGEFAKIGGYSIIQEISQSDWFNTGFYAIAYKHDTTGKIIISYRGTDKNSPGLFGGRCQSEAQHC
jgi:hypothetical protein